MNINIIDISGVCAYMTHKIQNSYWMVILQKHQVSECIQHNILLEDANNMMHLAEEFMKSKPRKYKFNDN